MIKLAVAKGRITKDAGGLLTELGFDVDEVRMSRKLILYNQTRSISLVLLKAPDIPLYVQNGAVDIGVVGKDTVLEADRDVYELGELDFSKCRLCLAGPVVRVPLENGIRIATKYPGLTKGYLQSKGVQGEIIPLSGSIELAPLIALSDVIVDLVQTGQTLKDNQLEVYETIMEIAPMVIVNQVSYRTKSPEVQKFMQACERYVKADEII